MKSFDQTNVALETATIASQSNGITGKVGEKRDWQSENRPTAKPVRASNEKEKTKRYKKIEKKDRWKKLPFFFFLTGSLRGKYFYYCRLFLLFKEKCLCLFPQ